MANIDAALMQLRQERDTLNEAIAALEGISIGTRSPRLVGRRRRRALSSAGRRRIAAAQKARWAKWRKQKKGA